VTGKTSSSSLFPLLDPIQANLAGSRDAFLARIDPQGPTVGFSTYYGGKGHDEGTGVALGTTGRVWFAGVTVSTDFPVLDPLDGAGDGTFGDAWILLRSDIPRAPGDLAASIATPQVIRLSWKDRTALETAFEIQRRTGANAFATIGTVGAGVESLLDGGLAPETTYDYRVRATNASGASEWTAPASATTLELPPTAPTGLVVSPSSPNSVLVSWTDTSGNEDSFLVYRRAPGGALLNAATVPADTASHEVGGLLPALLYGFAVQAHGATGVSALTPELFAETPPTMSVAPVKGTVKDSVKTGKDSLAMVLDLAALPASADGLVDPVAEGLVFRAGGTASPWFALDIPAASPAWKTKKTKSTWKSPKKTVPRIVLVFDAATGRATLKASRATFVFPPAIEVGAWVLCGDDAGLMTGTWQEKKAGVLRYPPR
jgi:hypothetical protein